MTALTSLVLAQTDLNRAGLGLSYACPQLITRIRLVAQRRL